MSEQSNFDASSAPLCRPLLILLFPVGLLHAASIHRTTVSVTSDDAFCWSGFLPGTSRTRADVFLLIHLQEVQRGANAALA